MLKIGLQGPPSPEAIQAPSRKSKSPQWEPPFAYGFAKGLAGSAVRKVFMQNIAYCLMHRSARGSAVLGQSLRQSKPWERDRSVRTGANEQNLTAGNLQGGRGKTRPTCSRVGSILKWCIFRSSWHIMQQVGASLEQCSAKCWEGIPGQA